MRHITWNCSKRPSDAERAGGEGGGLVGLMTPIPDLVGIQQNLVLQKALDYYLIPGFSDLPAALQ